MTRFILGILSLVLHLIVLLCVVVATPLDQIRSDVFFGQRMCYSIWGAKECGSHKSNPHSLPFKGFPCKEVRNIMNVAAAFAIISIGMTLGCAILCVLFILHITKRWIVRVGAIVTFLTILISWACVAAAFYQKCGGTSLSESVLNFSLYTGFGLMVVACALELITTILLFLA